MRRAASSLLVLGLAVASNAFGQRAPSAANQQEEQLTNRYIEYLLALQEVGTASLREIRNELAADERDRFDEAKLTFRITTTSITGSGCHRLGNIAFSKPDQNGGSTIFVCEEGWQTVNALAVAYYFLLQSAILDQGGGKVVSLEERALRGSAEVSFLKKMNAAADFIVSEYRRTVFDRLSKKIVGPGCIGVEVAFELRSGKQPKACNYLRAPSAFSGGSWALSTMGAAAAESSDAGKRPKPAPASALSLFVNRVSELVLRHLLRHEVAHLIVGDATIEDDRNADRRLHAETSADVFAIRSHDAGERVVNTMLAAYPLVKFWQHLEQVERVTVGMSANFERMRSLLGAICEASGAYADGVSDRAFASALRAARVDYCMAAAMTKGAEMDSTRR